ncbi:MAG: VWA domain-containing protein [Myxococcota bacterium]
MRRILFDVPLWHIFLHRDARGLPSAAKEDSPQLSFQDELFDVLYAGDAEPIDPVLTSGLAEWARSFHATCAAHPDFQRLAEDVRGDAYAAGLAVEKLLEQAAPPELESPVPPAPTLRRAISQGTASASQAIEQHREAVDGLAGVGGPSSAANPGTTEAAAARQLAGHLKSDSRLRQIAKLAGRFKRITSGRLRRRTRHGVDEVADIELGADVARLLPAEFVRLGHPLLRNVLIRSLVEGTAMQYQLRGSDTVGKGPLIVCVDKSESMDGEPDIWATAVSLALLEVAQTEKRVFGLVAFNDRIPFSVVVRPGEVMPWDALFVRCHGGTDIHNALTHSLDMVLEQQAGVLRHSDIVLVTDGESDSSAASMVKDRARAADVSILGIGIGVHERALSPWCNLVHAVVDMKNLPDATARALVDG